ncbi:MAG: ATP-dependent DNA ligase [Ilumatobacter sp.]|uniref:ATP-dependent DNA ligase n=1 Tax=Ilumatobacter sp. TaxID=1967498 RepID=UPI0026119934|nr:ATP-dependent DNA ligase [Ilumatobacter sp.]MDJ0769212.1 ATP-dependent DNA ligase [Ilumatobacter sp.]
MLFETLAITSSQVAATSKRGEKVALLAELFRSMSPAEIEAAASFAVGSTRLGRIGVGWATIGDVAPPAAADASLSIDDVDRAVVELAGIEGPGSVARRRELLHRLLEQATEPEQTMIRAIVGGELRQGALDGVLAAAVARAAGVKVGDVQRAAMFSGSLAVAARVALVEGAPGLSAIELVPAQPVQPMLASPATDVGDAIASTGEASVEWKLDGARIQAHRAGADVRLFTRNLNDVTGRLGGVVDVVRSLPGGDLVLDGEVLGVDESGAPSRFQDTMGDFGADARGGGLQAFFFDVLHAGEPVVGEPLAVRRQVLEATVPASSRLPAIVTADAGRAQAFMDEAIAAGHEGVMVKGLDTVYDAGRRGGAWRKVKPVYTFDLVVLAVEWGHGRRQGWLSNLHLGARGDGGAFVMVGKTFKGLTDEMLRWQTERFLGLQIGEGTGRERHVVHVRPEQVVEIAVDGVQASTRYPGGVALRFARVKRYRDDKAASEADTIEQVQGLLR